MAKERKTRKQFEFLNIKLLHNQSPENYIKLFEDLQEADYVVDTNFGRQLELLDFRQSNCSGVYVGKIVSYMRGSGKKWYNGLTKSEADSPVMDINLHPDLKEAFFFLIPERHRIALASNSEITTSQLKKFLDEACARLRGELQVSTSIEIDKKYIEDIKKAQEISRIVVTWSYTNKDFMDGLSNVLDKGAKDGNAAKVTTIIESARNESLSVSDDSLPGAILNLALSNNTSEAQATIRNPEYSKTGRRVKENRLNVSTSTYPLKVLIAFGATGLAIALYEYVMTRFREG